MGLRSDQGLLQQGVPGVRSPGEVVGVQDLDVRVWFHGPGGVTRRYLGLCSQWTSVFIIGTRGRVSFGLVPGF